MKITVVRKITNVETYSEVVDYDLIKSHADQLDANLPLVERKFVDDQTEFYDENGKCVDLIALEEFYDQL